MRGRCITGALLLILAGRPGLAAEVPQLLKDVVTQRGRLTFGNLPGLPEGFVQVGDRLLFSTPSSGITSLAEGGALWSTNGTPEGTQLVSATICPFPCTSITPVASWPGTALLEAMEDPYLSRVASSTRLWRTDGTPAGTFPLTEMLEPGRFEAFVQGSAPGTGLFYFSDCRPLEGCRLWRSDGTLLATHPLKDLKLSIVSHAAVAGKLYFLATSDEGAGLWVTDGTADGTQLLAAIPGSFFEEDVLVATPSRLFFTAGGSNLWVSDGTPSSCSTSRGIPRSRSGGPAAPRKAPLACRCR